MSARARISGQPLHFSAGRPWLEDKNRNAAATHLAAYGLTHRQTTALVERFGDGVVRMLEENPYLLVSAVPGMGFKRVDKAARRMNTPNEHTKGQSGPHPRRN